MAQERKQDQTNPRFFSREEVGGIIDSANFLIPSQKRLLLEDISALQTEEEPESVVAREKEEALEQLVRLSEQIRELEEKITELEGEIKGLEDGNQTLESKNEVYSDFVEDINRGIESLKAKIVSAVSKLERRFADEILREFCGTPVDQLDPAKRIELQRIIDSVFENPKISIDFLNEAQERLDRGLKIIEAKETD